jgi:hypothetical protein
MDPIGKSQPLAGNTIGQLIIWANCFIGLNKKKNLILCSDVYHKLFCFVLQSYTQLFVINIRVILLFVINL